MLAAGIHGTAFAPASCQTVTFSRAHPRLLSPPKGAGPAKTCDASGQDRACRLAANLIPISYHRKSGCRSLAPLAPDLRVNALQACCNARPPSPVLFKGQCLPERIEGPAFAIVARGKIGQRQPNRKVAFDGRQHCYASRFL